MSCDTQSTCTLTNLRRAFSMCATVGTPEVSVRETEEDILARVLSEDLGPRPVCPRFDAEFERGLGSSLNFL